MAFRHVSGTTPGERVIEPPIAFILLPSYDLDLLPQLETCFSRATFLCPLAENDVQTPDCSVDLPVLCRA